MDEILYAKTRYNGTRPLKIPNMMDSRSHLMWRVSGDLVEDHGWYLDAFGVDRTKIREALFYRPSTLLFHPFSLDPKPPLFFYVWGYTSELFNTWVDDDTRDHFSLDFDYPTSGRYYLSKPVILPNGNFYNVYAINKWSDVAPDFLALSCWKRSSDWHKWFDRERD